MLNERSYRLIYEDLTDRDKALTIEQIAYRYGYSRSFIRSACHRAPDHHPLPHIKHGESRPVIRVRPDVFEQWLTEEELIQTGMCESCKVSA